MTDAHTGPDWNRLFEIAVGPEGHFTTAQAADAGYSPQLLNRYLRSGRIRRVRRGVYRVVHFPAGEQEDLVEVWLWSDRAGVLSHETALALHDLSDLLPARIHLTLPAAWHARRLRVPDGVVLHYADVDDTERTWVGACRLHLRCTRSRTAPATSSHPICSTRPWSRPSREGSSRARQSSMRRPAFPLSVESS